MKKYPYLFFLMVSGLTNLCFGQVVEPHEIFQGISDVEFSEFNLTYYAPKKLLVIPDGLSQDEIIKLIEEKDPITYREKIQPLIGKRPSDYGVPLALMVEQLPKITQALHTIHPSDEYIKDIDGKDSPLNQIIGDMDTLYDDFRGMENSIALWEEMIDQATRALLNVKKLNAHLRIKTLHKTDSGDLGSYHYNLLGFLSYYEDVISDIQKYVDDKYDRQKESIIEDEGERKAIESFIFDSYTNGWLMNDSSIELASILYKSNREYDSESKVPFSYFLNGVFQQYYQPIVKLRLGLNISLMGALDISSSQTVETIRDTVSMALHLAKELDKRNEHHMSVVFDQFRQRETEWTWENVQRILDLHQYFGILAFRRYIGSTNKNVSEYYFVDELIKSAKNPKQNKKHKRNALVITARQGFGNDMFSPSSMFDVFNFIDYKQQIEQLQRTHNVYLFEIASDIAIVNAAKEFHKRTGEKIDLLVLAGHGSPKTMNITMDIHPLQKNQTYPAKHPEYRGAFSNTYAKTVEQAMIEISNDRETIAAIDEYLQKNADVVLYSCLTGKGGEEAENMMTFLAEALPGKEIYAPEDSISGAKIIIHPITGRVSNVHYYVYGENKKGKNGYIIDDQYKTKKIQTHHARE